MKKRTLISTLSSVGAILIAFVLFMVSHGNIKKAEENNELLAVNFTELGRVLEDITGGRPQMLASVRENKTRAVNAVNNLRKVCDYFEKVKVPGNLKTELAEVRASIPGFRRFLDKFENMFQDVMLESEFRSYVNELSDVVGTLTDENGFLLAEQRFMRKLKQLGDRRGGLMWL